MRFDRRSFIKSTAAFAVAAPAVFRITKVHGAEFSMKYANNTAASHPLSIRTKEAIEAIAKETGPSDYVFHKAHQNGGRPERLQNPRPAKPALDFDVQGF